MKTLGSRCSKRKLDIMVFIELKKLHFTFFETRYYNLLVINIIDHV